jgi:hypothetical protein
MGNNLGERLRSAVIDENIAVVKTLLEKGADVNYNQPDMVCPFGGTPLSTAALFGNFELVKLFIAHGADVTLADARGMRPYHYAAYGFERHPEIANHIKSLEPKELHDLEVKLDKLKSYSLSQDLIAFLQCDNLCVKLTGYEMYLYPKEVEFYSLVDTVETQFQERKLLLLTKDIDGASCELAWDSESKCIGYVDIEHDDYNTVCSFAEFMENPAGIIVKIVNGEYQK